MSIDIPCDKAIMIVIKLIKKHLSEDGDYVAETISELLEIDAKYDGLNDTIKVPNEFEDVIKKYISRFKKL